MTVQQIVAALLTQVDAERVKKAKGLAIRSKISWEQVLAEMTPEQRALVETV